MLRDLAAEGLLRLLVPAPFGGDQEAVEVGPLSAVRDELAYHSGLLDLLFVMQGLGSFPITLAGSEAQKRRYLPGVAEGSAVAGFAITEPDAGSDVAAIRTTARRDGEGYVLDGVKTLISNAPIADFFTLAARTGPAPGKKGLSLFILDRAAAGLTPGAEIALSTPHPIGSLVLSGCRVPMEARIGAEGDGFEIVLRTLDRFRVSVGAAAVGFARRALDEAIAYARRRVQFDKPIGEFEGIQFMLADMATQCEAAALLVARAAEEADAASSTGEGFAAASDPSAAGRLASMAKLFATESAQQVVDAAVQIHGGRGLVRGAIVESLYREVRALRIYEGTSEIQRSLIARSLLGG
jgi:acyl-CoA dehydrogenase